MKSSFKKLPGSKIELDVELSADEFKKYWDSAFELELANIHLKGFRPGQAPRELASKAVDPEKVFEKASHEAIRFSLNEVIQDNEWTIIDSPKISIKEGGDLEFRYHADLILFPEINLENYKKISQKSYADFNSRKKDIIVTEEEINNAIDWVKKSKANLENFKTDEDLKKSITNGLKMEKEEREKELQRIKLLEEITKESAIDIPQVMIDRTKTTIQGQNKQIITDEQARKNVAEHLIIYKIAELENLNPTPDEVGEQLQKYYGKEFDPVRSRDRDKRSRSASNVIDKNKLYDYIYGVLQSKKVFEFLEKI